MSRSAHLSILALSSMTLLSPCFARAEPPNNLSQINGTSSAQHRVDPARIYEFTTDYLARRPAADVDGNGEVNQLDLLTFVNTLFNPSAEPVGPAVVPLTPQVYSTFTPAFTVQIPGAVIRQGVSAALGSPSRYNWESVKVNTLRVTADDVPVQLTSAGLNGPIRIRSGNVFTVEASGVGDRNSRMRMAFTLAGIDATLSPQNRTAVVDARLRIESFEDGTRIWTRARDRFFMTFRYTLIPRRFDVQLSTRVRLTLGSDGRVTLTPLSWQPVNANDEVRLKLSGQRLPDGSATIRPLNASSVRVNINLPFGWGDRTISNPLRRAIDSGLMNKNFVLGRIPQ